MAKQANVNLLPATGASAIFELMDFLVSSLAWVVLEASDGTTYEADVPANGNPITGGGSGANGLGNANAWFRIREPNANVNPASGGIAREWTFQRDSGANDEDWRVKVSALDGFIGGTPGATQTPSAVDEDIIFGGGTDAAPTHTTMLPNDGTYRWHLVGFDIAENGVFPFYAWSADSGTGNTKALIFQEALLTDSFPALVGTRAAPTSGEPDPALYCCAYSTTAGLKFSLSSSSQAWQDRTNPPGRAWFAMNGSNGNTEAWTNWQFGDHGYSSSFGDIGAPGYAAGTDGYGPNPLSGEDELFPVAVARPAGLSSDVAFKGLTSHIRISGVSRQYPDTATVSGETWAYSTQNNGGAILLPFADGVVPLT
jgi:hypothetical protein